MRAPKATADVLLQGLWVLMLLWVLWPTTRLARAYNVFEEGYNNSINTNGTGFRNSDRPNLPYTIDTNRFSDGFTSSSPVEMTSTHFPEYVGALALTKTRSLHYTAYLQNAAIQGIAGYDAGDAVKEDARVALLKSYGNNIDVINNLPKPNATFKVYAAVKWNPSDFAIQEGENYSIAVLGSNTGFSSQFWTDGGIRINAGGYSSYFDAISNCYVALGRCRPHLKKKRRLPLENWMTLACGIGEFVRPIEEVQKGTESYVRFVPLSESTLQQTVFVVGEYLKFRAATSGMLICFANDAQTLYWNNRGFLEVTATRESWPPGNNTYYQELYLPACDSARVVYANITEPFCNPRGGGSGWSYESIHSTSASYGPPGKGIENLYQDRPAWRYVIMT